MEQKLFFLANAFTRFLGAEGEIALDDTQWASGTPPFVKNIINPIFGVLGWLIPVIMILIGIAGTIYAIVLGLNFAKAENAEQKDAAKKRLINVVIGVLVIIIALLLIFIFIKNANSIFGWVTNSAVAGTATNSTN